MTGAHVASTWRTIRQPLEGLAVAKTAFAPDRERARHRELRLHPKGIGQQLSNAGARKPSPRGAGQPGKSHNRKGSDGLGGLHDLQLCFARVVRLNTVIRNPLPDVKATRVRVVTHGFPVFSLNLREHLLLETRSAFHIGDWQSSFRGSSPFRNRLTPSSSAQSASHSPRT
jgi:hypothetical protein